MPWEGSDRKARLPDNWDSLVAFTRKRALTPLHPVEGQCQWKLPSGNRCPNAGSQCDHIIAGDNHDPRNLQWLCKHHHDKKSSREGNAARRRGRPRPKPGKRSEQHPGRKR